MLWLDILLRFYDVIEPILLFWLLLLWLLLLSLGQMLLGHFIYNVTRPRVIQPIFIYLP